MGDNVSDWTESNLMDHNVKVHLWKVMVDDESKQGVLKQNMSLCGNAMCNLMVVNESGWD